MALWSGAVEWRCGMALWNGAVEWRCGMALWKTTLALSKISKHEQETKRLKDRGAHKHLCGALVF